MCTVWPCYDILHLLAAMMYSPCTVWRRRAASLSPTARRSRRPQRAQSAAWIARRTAPTLEPGTALPRTRADTRSGPPSTGPHTSRRHRSPPRDMPRHVDTLAVATARDARPRPRRWTARGQTGRRWRRRPVWQRWHSLNASCIVI